jgi:hypothetical protein
MASARLFLRQKICYKFLESKLILHIKLWWHTIEKEKHKKVKTSLAGNKSWKTLQYKCGMIGHNELGNARHACLDNVPFVRCGQSRNSNSVCGYSGSKNYRWGYSGAQGGVWWSLRLAGLQSQAQAQAQSQVLCFVCLTEIWFQSLWRCFHICFT